ncbi:ATP-binding cassette domain-containing protein [bacterium]|nr:ATP-binding cassette domain-containing protein [bacterium]MCP5462350.1 ATP-binding cassette domain-containing protein [bacterium]
MSHVSKCYSGKRILDDVSFVINKGSITGLLGPNGAGKTTILKIIAGSLSPSEGVVSFFDKTFPKHTSSLKKRIGYMPENNPLYDDLTVKEYLYYRGQLKGVPPKKIKQYYINAVQRCDLTNTANQLIGTLSRGTKQRVGLADVLIHDPEILLLDEPTIGLDPEQICRVREIIKSIGATKTILLSSHILPEVESICENVVIIKNGKIHAQLCLSNLQSSLSQERILAIEIKYNTTTFETHLTSAQFCWKIDQQFSNHHKRYCIRFSSQHDIRETVFNLILLNQSTLIEMNILESRLEDVFMDIVRTEDSGL